MRRTAGLAALALVTIAGLAPGTALRPARAVAATAVTGTGVPGGTRLWAASFRDHTQQNSGQAVVASPDGSTVYVTGTSGLGHIATVAYDAATGAQRWVARYYGLGVSGPFAMAISPDGARLFISGFTEPPGSALPNRPAVVALNASTGARLWATHPFNRAGVATSVTVSPDSATVYVTGVVGNRSGIGSYVATFAFDAATGARRWLATHHGNATAGAAWVAASPDGREVVVSTPVTSSSGTKYIATLAYDAASGALMWTRFIQGTVSAPEGFGIGRDIGVSPDSSAVFVTGYVTGPSGGSSFATVAYRVATGTRLWERFFQGPGGTSIANALTVSPDGREVFVTGSSTAGGSGAIVVDYATVGYAATGTQLWARSYRPPTATFLNKNGAVAVGVSPDGRLVFVTGSTAQTATNNLNFTTIAYHAATGTTAWLAKYGGVQDFGAANSLAVSSAGRVFVTGEIGASDGCCNFGTVAYQP